MMADYIDIAIRYLWAAFGLTYRPIVAIVAVMAEDEKRSFEEALEWWAQYEAEGKPYAWPASRWRSEICYRLLKVGQEAPGGLAAWMQARTEEVRRIANESK
jgi:hypothetical protein